ncbi:SIMPL domain-containing protein [Peribacillus alkalitolerans]|uniref:SIMPL domain-containing protein n=1 Tax=Peribacillus alkalitolerans TaxID=1550385 RepID=UPI0013D58E57|nr:SIMPL domain-containing protein [Peribacillus alkalitolerans]
MYRQTVPPPAPTSSAKITVEGTGTVKVQPDRVNITIGVVTDGTNVTEIQAKNAATMNQVLTSIKQLGIPDSAIQTTQYQIDAQYDYSKTPPAFIGYKVTNAVNVTINEIGKTGIIIDSAVKNGANFIGSITFTVSSPSAYYQSALTLAVQDARQKAVTLARASGYNKEPIIVDISEVFEQGPRPYMVASAKYDITTPIQPGELSINAKIIVKFKLPL